MGARARPLGRQPAEGAPRRASSRAARRRSWSRSPRAASTSARRPTSTRRCSSARDAGVAVLLISSELDELRRLSDRIVVMRRGRPSWASSRRPRPPTRASGTSWWEAPMPPRDRAWQAVIAVAVVLLSLDLAVWAAGESPSAGARPRARGLLRQHVRNRADARKGHAPRVDGRRPSRSPCAREALQHRRRGAVHVRRARVRGGGRVAPRGRRRGCSRCLSALAAAALAGGALGRPRGLAPRALRHARGDLDAHAQRPRRGRHDVALLGPAARRRAGAHAPDRRGRAAARRRARWSKPFAGARSTRRSRSRWPRPFAAQWYLFEHARRRGDPRARERARERPRRSGSTRAARRSARWRCRARSRASRGVTTCSA